MLPNNNNVNNNFSKTLARMEAEINDHNDFVKFMQDEFAAYNALTNVEPELEAIKK